MASEAHVAAHRIVTLDPATDERLAELDCAGRDEVFSAVARARAAQPAWAAAGAAERVRVLRRFQQLLHAKKTQVATLITREAGKPYVESLLTEVLVALDTARFLCGQAHSFLRPESIPHGNLILKAKSGRLVREPQGVI